MRTPVKRHVLAQVRLDCGLTQKELGQLLNVSAITIQRIEQGTLGLPEKLANRAEKELDVAAAWLLANDSTLPPHSPRYSRWSKELYELVQGRHETQQGPESEVAEQLTTLRKTRLHMAVDSLLESTNGLQRQAILFHRLNEAIKNIQKYSEAVAGAQKTLEAAAKINQLYGPIITKIQADFNRRTEAIADREKRQLSGDVPTKRRRLKQQRPKKSKKPKKQPGSS